MSNTQKFKYTKYSTVRSFLDIEAQVDSEEEDDDEEPESNDFIDDAPPVPCEPSPSGGATNPTPQPHTEHGSHQREHAENVDEAERIISRYRETRKEAHVHDDDADMYESGWKESIRFMPSIHDPSLWRVDVKRGSESMVVFTVFERAISRGIPVGTAFCRKGIPGAVYIEGNYDDCISVLDGISTVYIRRRQAKSLIQLVSLGDRVGLLRSSESVLGPTLTPASFVRIRNRSSNRNDLGYINSISEDGVAEIFVVPRKPTAIRGNRGRAELLLEKQYDKEKDHYVAPLPLTDDNHILGLRICHIPAHQLQLTSVNPTLWELALFEASPLFQPSKRLPSDTSDLVEHRFAKATKKVLESVDKDTIKSFTNLILTHRRSALPLCPDDPVIAVSGIFTGIQGTVTEVSKYSAFISTSALASYAMFEVPISQLLAQEPPSIGSMAMVDSGPYRGVSGIVMSLTEDDCVVIDPKTVPKQQIEIPVWELSRRFHVGDYISASSHTVKFCEPDAPIAAQVSQQVRVQPQDDPFRGLEVLIIGKHVLKGRTGYIVGHFYQKPDWLRTSAKSTGITNHEPEEGAREEGTRLVFSVNEGINMTSYSSLIGAEHLLERFSGLPILAAVNLPRCLLKPPNVPPRLRAATPPFQSEDDYLSFSEEEDPIPHSTQHRKVGVIIRRTTGMNCQGKFVSKPFHRGAHEGRQGSVVITKALKDSMSSVMVRVEDQTNLSFRIKYLDPLQDEVLFNVGVRVVIIGPDSYGLTNEVGRYGWITACVYELPAQQRLIHIEPQTWTYFPISSLCYSGELIEWDSQLV
ncbi:hypothetical protein ONZ45_g7938 [Pleurotus djamor]|nr:hypothetical protein ONZ45_g7938 [Pleurotus djamor]